MPWVEQIKSRLAEELMPAVSLAELTASIERARAELDAPSAAALPELVERLVRVRLLTGRDSGSGAGGLDGDGHDVP